MSLDITAAPLATLLLKRRYPVLTGKPNPSAACGSGIEP